MVTAKKRIPFRLRLSFSMRSLVLVISLLCVWLGHWSFVKKRHQDAFQDLRSRGVGVTHSLEEPLGPNFLYIDPKVTDVPPNGYFPEWFVDNFCIKASKTAYVNGSKSYIEGVEVGEVDWELFENLVALRTVDISYLEVDAFAIECLKRCKSLRNLEVFWCEFDSTAFKALSEWTELEILLVADSGFSCAEVAQLEKALPNTDVRSACDIVVPPVPPEN